jgi:hypothetical protein
MRVAKLIGFLILLNASAVCAQEKLRIIEGLSMSSKILSQDVKYSIILPEDYYTSNKNYPVVYPAPRARRLTDQADRSRATSSAGSTGSSPGAFARRDRPSAPPD